MRRVRPAIEAIVLATLGALATSGCDRSDSAVAPRAPFTVTVEPTVELCQQAPDSDVFGIVDVVVAGDDLRLSVEFFGGCGGHVFRLCSSGEIVKGDTPWVTAFLSHENTDDPCEGTHAADLEFDLTPLRITGQRQVGIAVQDMMLFYKY